MCLAIDDADVSNSAMTVIPDSHAAYREYRTVESRTDHILSRQVVVTEAMELTAFILKTALGSLSLHDSFLPHGSGANRTPRRRPRLHYPPLQRRRPWVHAHRHPIPYTYTH